MKRNYLFGLVLLLFAFNACTSDDPILDDGSEILANAGYTLKSIEYALDEGLQTEVTTIELPNVEFNNHGDDFLKVEHQEQIPNISEVSSFDFNSPIDEHKLSDLEVPTPELLGASVEDIEKLIIRASSRGLVLTKSQQSIQYKPNWTGTSLLTIPPKHKIIYKRTIESVSIKTTFVAELKHKITGEITTINGKWEGVVGFWMPTTSVEQEKL